MKKSKKITVQNIRMAERLNEIRLPKEIMGNVDLLRQMSDFFDGKVWLIVIHQSGKTFVSFSPVKSSK